jgi:hypothetical protein
MHPTPHNWREARRLQAWHLKQQGWSQRQMAEALVVSEGAVRQGMARARNAGHEALRRRPPPGAPRRLSPEPLARLPELCIEGLPPTAFAANCGPAVGSQPLSAWHLVSPISRVLWAAYSMRRAGVRKTPPGVLDSATKPPLRICATRPGRPSKRGTGPAANDFLHRRVRVLSAAQCRAPPCPRRPDAYSAGMVHPRPPLRDQCHLARGQTLLPCAGSFDELG